MPAPKIKHFTVRGTGHFPLDMLRHDCCWPHTSEDASAMAFDARYNKHSEVRTVELSFVIGNVTHERWRSFGWLVVKEPK